jgi:hypothetical protein
MDEVERSWREFWKPKVTNRLGIVSLAKVKRELYDYQRLMENAARVYDHVTNGRVTKPTVSAAIVCQEADKHLEAQSEIAAFLRDTRKRRRITIGEIVDQFVTLYTCGRAYGTCRSALWYAIRRGVAFLCSPAWQQDVVYQNDRAKAEEEDDDSMGASFSDGAGGGRWYSRAFLRSIAKGKK